uniref:GTD-binding domain-containing protein n=1 Tax=Leersia perrieri TaxID=77586 RepID=A0A0D9WVS7_9ORYZ
MDAIATISSTSPWPSSSWCRSVRRRVPEAEEERELGRRVEETESAVERLRAEKESAEAEEAELRAELDAERAAAETAASEAMLMIERLQREKAAALIEARHFRRLADGRAARDKELQDELASVSALANSYLSLLHAHGIDPDGDGDNQPVRPSVEHLVDVEVDSSGSDSDFKDAVVVVQPPSPPDSEKVFEHAAAAAEVEEEGNCAVDVSGKLCARVEALEAYWMAMRREMAALRAERAQAVMAREVARRLCREAVVAGGGVVTAEKPRFSVNAICKVDSALPLVPRWIEFVQIWSDTLIPLSFYFIVDVLHNLQDKEMFYSQVYVWLVNYGSLSAYTCRQIRRAASTPTSAHTQTTNVTTCTKVQQTYDGPGSREKISRF